MSAHYMQKILDYLNTPEGENEIPSLKKTYLDILNSQNKQCLYDKIKIANKLFNTDINKTHIFSINNKCYDIEYEINAQSIEHIVNIELDYKLKSFEKNDNCLLEYNSKNVEIKNVKDVDKINIKFNSKEVYYSNPIQTHTISIESDFLSIENELKEDIKAA